MSVQEPVLMNCKKKNVFENFRKKNSFKKQHLENGKLLFFLGFFHQKVTHAQDAIAQVWHIEFERPLLLMSHLTTAIHVLRNTSSQSAVICHIQMKLIRILYVVLSC